MGNDFFAKRVKSLREQKKITIEQLAKSLNVNVSRVGMWESNGTVPRQDALVKLAEFFCVSVDSLLSDDGSSIRVSKNKKINSIQRRLEKLNEEELKKADDILRTIFADSFGDAYDR